MWMRRKTFLCGTRASRQRNICRRPLQQVAGLPVVGGRVSGETGTDVDIRLMHRERWTTIRSLGAPTVNDCSKPFLGGGPW